MIKCNLAVLMAERGLNITKLSKDTGISRNALSSLYHNTGKGIQYDTLDTLCDYFDVPVERLLTHLKVLFSCKTSEWIEKDHHLEIDGELLIYDQPIPCRLEIYILEKDILKEGIDEFTSLCISVNLYREAAHFPTVLPEEQLKALIFDNIFEILANTYNDLVVLSINLNQKFI
ncbi:helix-turn-helix domain-containing protein [Bacillus chungangensis]|uniref:DNA-binding Xre family transcriptional regulator n=1 Tax=Bacillus chungangensis TaxID=587633 RepID=A0ABT9WRZ3_9BACI|nr:helix-turn-helix transcriptional regulator [Bacillus chungangensis]MDQ0175985.1 DNA-binding Xre family transcriptional regulator [Bacillus chungangensis]